MRFFFLIIKNITSQGTDSVLFFLKYWAPPKRILISRSFDISSFCFRDFGRRVPKRRVVLRFIGVEFKAGCLKFDNEIFNLLLELNGSESFSSLGLGELNWELLLEFSSKSFKVLTELNNKSCSARSDCSLKSFIKKQLKQILIWIFGELL